ncbi:ChbG/HpnK family deacetylase [bacterium]|nr:ChbG/HpnK family deacetylase [bacterium]
MNNKKFILNADNFGNSRGANRAVLEGYHNGFLTSASLSANGSAFNSAVNEIIPECPNLGIGVHLNITSGNSLSKVPLLTDKKGKFNKVYHRILVHSNSQSYLEQVEFEFRTQIETVMNYAKVDHIDSNSHIHAIPNIFKITAKLAKEYNIPFIRTHYEEVYFVNSIKKHLNIGYMFNLNDALILNSFSLKNKDIVKEFGLKTNDYIIGTEYKNMMDTDTVEYGLKQLDEDCIAECIINPAALFGAKKKNYNEFLITQDKELKDKITRLGFEITNYRNIT